MDQEIKSPLELAAETLKAARNTVQELIGESHVMIAANVAHQLDILYNRLMFMHGGAHTNHVQKIETEPVTHMFGSEIRAPRKIAVEQDLDPKELERRLFADKVDRLQLAIFKLDDKAILESYQQEQHVIRGVAKRAGLEDFKEAAVNEEFLGRIRVALKTEVVDNAKVAEEKAKVPAPAQAVKSPADIKPKDTK